MLLSLSILGIFLSIILLIYNASKFTSSIYLGLVFILLSLYGLSEYAIFSSKSLLLLVLMLLTVFIYYMVCPGCPIQPDQNISLNSPIQFKPTEQKREPSLLSLNTCPGLAKILKAV
jgi:hypothetical protein